MSILGVNDMLAAYQYANKAQKNNATGKTSFADTVKQTAENSSASREEQYVEYLKQRYGANVMVKNIGNDQRSIDNFGASIAGYNNIVIAPNILEEMANNPEKAAHYEKIIQKGLDDLPRCKAEMSMNGFEMSSYAVSIDEKGVGYVYVTGDLKPEVRAKIEAKVRAEQAAKRARRVRYQELAEEAAAERREQTELQYHKQLMEDALKKSGLDTAANYHFISRSQVSAAAMAYESAIGAYSSNVLGNT